jgi:TolA-binding protein
MSDNKKPVHAIEPKGDNILNSILKLKELIIKNQKMVFIGIIVAIALVVVAILMNNRAIANKKIASEKLTAIMESYSNFNFNKALNGDSLQGKDGFVKIVDEYGSTNSGNIAKLLVGNSYYSLSNFDKANEYYEDFSGSSKMFKAASIAGQAAVYEAKKDFAKAADYYLIASKEDEFNPTNSELLLKASNNFIKIGELEKAEEILNTLKKDYPKTKSAREVERYFGKISVKKLG